MDPLDVCEVGQAQGHTGQVKQVKILGVWAMIDDGETDWKVLVIDVTDPNASKINSVADLEHVYPGVVQKTFEFLRDYKIPAGAGPNHFAFNNELKNQAYAYGIIDGNVLFCRCCILCC
jgi:inorganic pyrophosphatase